MSKENTKTGLLILVFALIWGCRAPQTTIPRTLVSPEGATVSSTAVPPRTATTTPTRVIVLLEEIELPFETIEKNDNFGVGYADRSPQLIVMACAEEISKIENIVSKQAQVQLYNLDFDQYFVVAIFQGWKPTTEYEVEVKNVMQNDDVFTLYVHFGQPDPQFEKHPIVTSPYHIVAIQKPRQLGKESKFALNVDGTIVGMQIYSWP